MFSGQSSHPSALPTYPGGDVTKSGIWLVHGDRVDGVGPTDGNADSRRRLGHLRVGHHEGDLVLVVRADHFAGAHWQDESTAVFVPARLALAAVVAERDRDVDDHAVLEVLVRLPDPPVGIACPGLVLPGPLG
eukprot:3934708-Rhodomonas_salina.1